MSTDVIVSSFDPICIVGGARIGNSEIQCLSRIVGQFVAADGGADHLLAAGVTPAAVIGDLDSLSPAARVTFARQLWHIPEQDTTDFEKTLCRVAAPWILALGFTGGRMDHALAVLNVLARYRDRAVVLLDSDDASFVAADGPMSLGLPVGSRISLMPLADVRVTATGLRWPLDDRAMHPTGTISASNEVAQPQVHIHSTGPLLITLPRAHLAAILTDVAPAE